MIDLKKAVYCWDPDTGEAAVEAHPLEGRRKGWWTAGACSMPYDRLSAKEQRVQLLLDAWQSVVRDGVKPAAAHRALMQVQGMSELFAEDCQEVA